MQPQSTVNPNTKGYPQQQGYPQTQPMAQPVNYPAYPASPNAGGYGYVQLANSAPQIPLPVVQSIFSKPATPEERIVFLSQYDIMLLVDTSPSINNERWNQKDNIAQRIMETVLTYDICDFEKEAKNYIDQLRSLACDISFISLRESTDHPKNAEKLNHP